MSDYNSDHNSDIASVLGKFFSISLEFARFFRSYFVLSKLLEFKEFNKTIIPFALVAYIARFLVGYLPFHIQRALME